MPELPEVETVRRGLENLCGKKVSKIFRSDKKLRIASTLDLQELDGSTITEISRRARYLLIHFNNKKTLIVHLGMSGRITVKHEFEQLKHDHFACKVGENRWLIFNDPRRFGFVDLIETKNLQKHKMLAKLGLEPLSKEFDAIHLGEKLHGKKMNIKTSLMDNEVVVGVGNIYASESLFDAKILPTRSAASLNKKDLAKLTISVKEIIQKAIDAGGSSISDYVDAKGDQGNFQNNFKVYGREAEKCLICKDTIRKIAQNGRSTFYCPSCQK